jgi:hypothetical protein
MSVLDPWDADGSRYHKIILPMGSSMKPFTMQTAVQFAEKLDCTVMPLEVGSYFGKDSKGVAQRSLISKLQEAGIKESTAIKPILALSGENGRAPLAETAAVTWCLPVLQSCGTCTGFARKKNAIPIPKRPDYRSARPGSI